MNAITRRPPLNLRLLLWACRPTVAAELGKAEAEAVLAATEHQIVILLARMPVLSPHKDGAQEFLLATAAMLGFHRAMKARGHPMAQTAALLYRAADRALRRIPVPVRNLYRWWFFRPSVHRKLVASLLGTGPNDFAGRFVPGDGSFDFGVDYTACALRRFVIAEGEAELAPYICQLDYVQSEIFGLGLQRGGTLSQGASLCDFRWKRGRATPAGWPPPPFGTPRD